MTVDGDRWMVHVDVDADTPQVPYGPADDTLPAWFTASVTYPKQGLSVVVGASYTGTGRVRIDGVSVTPAEGRSITPEDMTALQLAAVMAVAVREAAQPPPLATRRGRSGPPTDAELLALARTYWFEHAAWGHPRRAVMAGFELPRTTANAWIRKARERYDLPGDHW